MWLYPVFSQVEGLKLLLLDTVLSHVRTIPHLTLTTVVQDGILFSFHR